MIAIALSTFAEPHQAMVDDRGAIFTLGVHIDCAASLFALGQSPVGRDTNLVFAYQQAYYTAIAKQKLMETLSALPDLEAVVFIDGDMAFSPQDFEDLVACGRSTKGMVGGFYPSRQKVGEVIGAAVSKNPVSYQALFPVPATYVGLGFCFVPAGVFKEMKSKPWVQASQRPDGSWELEDQCFSRKVLEETSYMIWGRRFNGLSHAFNTRRSMDTMLARGQGV